VMVVLSNSRASRFPVKLSVKSMPAKSRSKSFGLRIRRSTRNRCSNAVPSKGVTFVTSTSGGSPFIDQEARLTVATRRKHAREQAIVRRGLDHTGTSESEPCL
jgi:hypothetical protein